MRYTCWLITLVALLLAGCQADGPRGSRGGRRGIVRNVPVPPGLAVERLAPRVGEARERAEHTFDQILASLPRPDYLPAEQSDPAPAEAPTDEQPPAEQAEPSADDQGGEQIAEDERIDLNQEWLYDYEVESYLFFRSIMLGYRVTEAPVTKLYPASGSYTKMRAFSGWWSHFRPALLLALRLRK